MPPEEQEPQREEIEKAARDRAERLARFREAAGKLDQNPSLLAAARRMRERLPGDERFGDPLSTAGRAPVEVVARGISSLRPERESLIHELGLAGLQVWQSIDLGGDRSRPG
jgi:adenylate cyclase